MINLTDVNSKLLKAHYAVRGKIVIRAQELEEQGKKIIYCNIGNPQALKQKPLTFVRQMLSLVEYPALMTGLKRRSFSPPTFSGGLKCCLKKIRAAPGLTPRAPASR